MKKIVRTIGLIFALVVMSLLLVGCGEKYTEIQATYDGDTAAGVVLDAKNTGFHVIGITEEGEELEIKKWKIEEPVTLEKDSSPVVVIKYKDFTCDVEVECSEKTVVSLDVEYDGATEEGIVLDESNSGITVRATYKSGDSEKVSGWMVKDPETLKRDETATVLVEYEGVTGSCDVECSTSAVKSLNVTYSGETKEGTILDSKNNGFKVTATHKNGTTSTVSDWTIHEAATLKADESSVVTVEYEGVTKVVTVECSTLTLTGITASYSGDTDEGTVVGKGDDSITVTATYKNGKEENVSGWTTDNEVTLKAGETSSLTIKYEDKECTLQILCTTMSKEQYIAQCQAFSYDQVARDPDNYIGKYATFTGEVLQCLEQTAYGYTICSIRLAICQKSWGWSSDEVIYITYILPEGASRILEDDVMTFYGVMNGLYSYEAVSGATITLPTMIAKYTG